MKKIKLTALLLAIMLLSSCNTGTIETPVPGYDQTYINNPDQTGNNTSPDNLESLSPGTTESDPSSSQTSGEQSSESPSNPSTASASIPAETGTVPANTITSVMTSTPVVKTPTPTPVVKTPTPTPKPTSASGVYIPEPGTYTGSISIKTAKTTGTQVTSNGATIDTGNASQGYIMVKKTSSILTQVIVTGPKGTYQGRYILSDANTFYPIPLQMGDGSYTITILQHVVDNKFTPLVKTTISVSISSDYTLVPNLLVNYNASSSSVKKAFDLCVNAKNDLECVAAVYNFITKNIKYDYDKAKTVTPGYIPNPDDTLKTKKGICYDYSSLMAAMLRAKGIPTRLVIGKADGSLHAWNEVYIKTIGWIAIEIKSNGSWKLLDSTFGTSYTGSQIDNVTYTSLEYY